MDAPPRNRALDGLRALAALTVVIDHGLLFSDQETDIWPPLAPAPAGVRLFFVLSGFLITGILAAARRDADAAGISYGRVWRAFLMRRALRIFPLAWSALAVGWVVGIPAVRAHGWWYVTYLQNIELAFPPHLDLGIAHFWSLAVEEHFYLVWPALILLAPRRYWRPAILTLMVGVCVGRVLTIRSLGLWTAYLSTWCRIDALAFGGFMAIVRPRLTTLALTAAALTAIGAATPSGAVHVSLIETAAILWLGCLILAVANGWGARILSARPLVYLGTISYGIYVWHWMVPSFFPAIPNEGGIPRVLALLCGGIGFASLSWYLYERPLNRLKRHFDYVPASAVSQDDHVSVSPASA